MKRKIFHNNLETIQCALPKGEEGNKKQKTEEDELKKELAELKKNLAAVDKKLGVIADDIRDAIKGKDEKMEEKLEKQQAELKQQQANFQERIKNVQQKLVGKFITTAIQEDSDRSALKRVDWVLEENPMHAEIKNKIGFVEDDNFKTIRAYLLEFVRKIPDARNQKFYIIRGPMGVGETTIVWKAVEKACVGSNWIPAYISMVDVVSIPKVNEDTPHDHVLASALLYIFTGVIPSDIRALNIVQVTEEIAKARDETGEIKIILHIDEFQKKPKITNLLFRACRRTLTLPSRIRVIPILSGIHDLSDIEAQVVPSEGTCEIIEFGPLPKQQLLKSFRQAIGVDERVFEKDVYLRSMFQDCGNLAYLVVLLVDAIKRKKISRLKETLTLAKAQGIFVSCLEKAKMVYGPARFHMLFTKNPNEWKGDEMAKKHDSYNEITLPLIRKLVLLASTRYGVKTKDIVVDSITIENCLDMGLFRLSSVVPNSKEEFIEIPLLGLMLLNQLCDAIPVDAKLSEPFDHSWQSLERVAMCSLYTQIAVRETEDYVSLQALRPGAYYQSSLDDTIFVQIPKELKFTNLKTFLQNDEILNEQGNQVNLKEIGNFCICTAGNQYGVDGWVNFKGKINGEKECTIIWLSQSKKQEISGDTGELSGKKLGQTEIAKQILSKMKKLIGLFEKTFENVFIVYDVFSDRLTPQRTKEFDLDENEAMFLTREDTLDTVLAGFVARKRKIVN